MTERYTDLYVQYSYSNTPVIIVLYRILMLKQQVPVQLIDRKISLKTGKNLKVPLKRKYNFEEATEYLHNQKYI